MALSAAVVALGYTEETFAKLGEKSVSIFREHPWIEANSYKLDADAFTIHQFRNKQTGRLEDHKCLQLVAPDGRKQTFFPTMLLKNVTRDTDGVEHDYAGNYTIALREKVRPIPEDKLNVNMLLEIAYDLLKDKTLTFTNRQVFEIKIGKKDGGFFYTDKSTCDFNV